MNGYNSFYRTNLFLIFGKLRLVCFVKNFSEVDHSEPVGFLIFVREGGFLLVCFCFVIVKAEAGAGLGICGDSKWVFKVGCSVEGTLLAGAGEPASSCVISNNCNPYQCHCKTRTSTVFNCVSPVNLETALKFRLCDQLCGCPVRTEVLGSG